MTKHAIWLSLPSDWLAASDAIQPHLSAAHRPKQAAAWTGVHVADSSLNGPRLPTCSCPDLTIRPLAECLIMQTTCLPAKADDVLICPNKSTP